MKEVSSKMENLTRDNKMSAAGAFTKDIQSNRSFKHTIIKELTTSPPQALFTKQIIRKIGCVIKKSYFYENHKRYNKVSAAIDFYKIEIPK